MRSIEVMADGSQAIRPSDYVSARVLAANASEQITVPEGATHVLLQGTADFYAAYGANPTAVIPSDTDDGTSNELNPTMRFLGRGVFAKIAVISATANAIVTASFWTS